MFDAVLNKSQVPQSRIGTGALISIVLHAGLIAFAIWISVRPPPVHRDKDVSVKFMLPPPPPPPPPPKRIEIDESNIKLQKVSGPQIQYTDKALEKEIEGTMVVKCVVTADGSVNNCRVLKSLPFMDRAAIDAIERWRYKPYTVDGKPAEV